MKQYKIHRNIRKQALLFGLPLSFFALQLISVIGSLLVIIFSFGLGVLLGVLLWNGTLFIVLIQLSKNPQRFQVQKAFPVSISNKQSSQLQYERN